MSWADASNADRMRVVMRLPPGCNRPTHSEVIRFISLTGKMLNRYGVRTIRPIDTGHQRW